MTGTSQQRLRIRRTTTRRTTRKRVTQSRPGSEKTHIMAQFLADIADIADIVGITGNPTGLLL
jgi:hypothetical protein